MLMTLILEKNVYLPNVSKRAIGIINFEMPFFELFRRYNELVSIGLKTLLHERLSRPSLLRRLSIQIFMGRTFFLISLEKSYNMLQTYWL